MKDNKGKVFVTNLFKRILIAVMKQSIKTHEFEMCHAYNTREENGLNLSITQIQFYK